jgi:hypothetical protein
MAVQDLQAGFLLEKVGYGGRAPELHVASPGDGGIRVIQYLPPDEIAENLLRRYLYNHEPGNTRGLAERGNWIIQMLDHMAKHGNTECIVSER